MLKIFKTKKSTQDESLLPSREMLAVRLEALCAFRDDLVMSIDSEDTEALAKLELLQAEIRNVTKHFVV